MEDEDLNSFGALLKTLRKRRRLTQQQLAETIGMHRHAISRWEQGDVLPASKAIVLDVARCLRLSDHEARSLLDASLTAPAPLWAVPFPRNLFFTGREETLQALHAHLRVESDSAGSQAAALCGLGGVGKTQAALEYAYRYALEYRAIFWIEAETMERVQFSLQRIARLLQLPECTAPDQQRMVEAVQRWLSAHPQWLLIWDNLEDLELPSRMLPPSRQGTLLFTTRRQALGTLARRIDLLPMEHEEAILLLLRRAKVLELESTDEQVQRQAASRPDEYTAASDLVTTLGGLPLALDQAGAYLEETGCSLGDYLRRFEKQQTSLLERRGGPGGDHPHSVTTTFRLSQERVEQELTAASDLLRVCAFLHAEAIPEELFAAGIAHLGARLASIIANPTRFDLALAALRNLSLVHRQAHTHTLSLHRLIQAVVRGQMEPAEERLWSERVIRLVNAAFPAGDFATWDDCERLLAQALACVPLTTSFGKDLPEAGNLLQKAGRYLLERGRFEEAEPLLAQAVTLGEQQRGPSDPVLIPRLLSQAELAWRQGNYERAEALASRALAVGEQHLEPNHVQVADALNDLAVFRLDQGKYEGNESLLQRALRIREQVLGPGHSEVATTLNNLGALYRDQGEYTSAESSYQRALDIREQALGAEHPEIANALANLAVLYIEQSKYEQAEPLLQRALDIREQSLGAEHPDVASTLCNLAIVYREQGKYEQAEPLFHRSLRIREQALGAEHPDIIFSLGNLAILYREQRKYEQAESLFQRALDIQKQAVGPEHPTVATLLSNLANVYRLQGKYEQAEPLFQRALQIREQELGADHPAVAFTLYGLATLYAERGQDSQAETLYQQALYICEQRLSASHPETEKNLTALANLYKRQGKEEQAMLLLQRLDAEHFGER